MRLNALRRLGTVLLLLGVFSASAMAAAVTDPPLALRAGKADSPYHALPVELVAALSQQGAAAPALAVAESQGSVQNVISDARRGNKPYGKNPRYADVRALFPIPFQTMHWVVRKDADIKSFADLSGRPFAPGTRGSFSERQTATVLKLLGLEDRAQLIDIDPTAADAALAGNQISGFATSGPFPIPSLADLAQKTTIRLLSLTPDQVKQERASDGTTVATVIPRGTYAGVDEDTMTVALPAAIYTTRRLSNADAYRITKAFWTSLPLLSQNAPVWRAVTPKLLSVVGAKLHPGALKYYRETGIDVPAKLR